MKSFREWLRGLACFECEGYGTIYDPNDPPDPIEGNKCRNKLKCPRCKGAKLGHESDYVDAYCAYVKVCIRQELFKQDQEELKAKLEKILSPRELDFLKRNGIK